MSKLLDYIKKCRKAGFGDEAIKKYLLSYNAPSSLVDEAFRKLDFFKRVKIAGAFTLLILMIGVFAFNPQFIGFVTQGDNVVYSDNVNLDLAESGSVLWTPLQSGELTSLLATGKVIGNGTVKMYIRINDTRYLVIDTSTLQETSASLLTGMVIGNETSEEIIIEEEPASNESEELVVEENITQTVEETINLNETATEEVNETTIINETINETSDIFNETISLETNSTDLTNETIIDNNSTEVINETIIVNETETVVINETIVEEINETVVFETNETVVDVNESIINESEFLFKEFENFCEETCVLPSLSGLNYTLEFEIEGDARIIVDILKYTVTEVVVEENINENITINETTASNLTIIESNATINSSVEIEKPVKWLMKVDKTKTKEVILPKESFNITVSDDDVIVLIKDSELNITDYNLEKEKDILKKELKKLEIKQLKEKNKLLKNKLKTTKTIYDEKIIETNARITELTAITTNLTIDEDIILIFNNETMLSNETNNSIVSIEYFTEGPDMFEDEKSDYNKLVTISSDLHYENIKAYTDIIETQKELISLYWLKDEGRIKVYDINYVDTNSNGLIDRIEWTVPHLSNETYEVNISVLNVQSYPQVGGTWIVSFQTTGKANLTITTEDDTYFGEDLEHVSLKCGQQTLNPTYDGVKVFMQDFECNETAYHEVLVKTQGKHTQKFTFGDATAFAYNFAGNLPKTINLHGKLKNSTGGEVNTSVNFTFSLYQEASGGENVWTENQTINVSEGIYTAILGIVTPITVNFSQPYYLGIKVNSDSEMEPRVNLTNQPYAYNTFYAQEALDLSCTDCIGNTEINTTGTFTIDGNLNATNNITLGNSIIGTDTKPRIQITSTTIVINLQDS